MVGMFRVGLPIRSNFHPVCMLVSLSLFGSVNLFLLVYKSLGLPHEITNILHAFFHFFQPSPALPQLKCALPIPQHNPVTFAIIQFHNIRKLV